MYLAISHTSNENTMKELTATHNNTTERFTDLELLAMLKFDLRNFKKRKRATQLSSRQAA